MLEESLKSADEKESDFTGVLLSVSEGHAFETAVAEGRFATFEAAVNASADELGLTMVGDRLYSRAALSALQQGMEEASRGEFIPQEEVEAFFDEWQRELDERTDC
jgi:hypothetical protein